MSKSVTLDGQIVHGLDRFGSWRVLSMEGWDETPAEKTNSEARPLSDGDYEAEVFYGPRLVTLNGRLSAKSPGDAFTARERLTSLLHTPGRFQVDQFGLPRWGTARRGRIKPGQIKGRHLPFQMELRFIDPFKYGEFQSGKATLATPGKISQRGTVPAWPKVLISGGTNGHPYTLRLNGRDVVINRPLWSADNHEIDFRTGIFRVGGVVTRGAISAADFSPVLPGEQQTFSILSGTGAWPTATITYYDTYI